MRRSTNERKACGENENKRKRKRRSSKKYIGVPTPHSGRVKVRVSSSNSMAAGGVLSEGTADISTEASPPTPMRKRPRGQPPLESYLSRERTMRPTETTPLATSTARADTMAMEELQDPGEITLPESVGSSEMPSLIDMPASPLSPRPQYPAGGEAEGNDEVFQEREEMVARIEERMERERNGARRREAEEEMRRAEEEAEMMREARRAREILREDDRVNPTEEYMVELIREIAWQFESEVPVDFLPGVVETLRAEWRGMARNIPHLTREGIRDHMVRYGREMVDDEWMRSPITGTWYMIPEARRFQPRQDHGKGEATGNPRDPRLARVREQEAYNDVPPPARLLDGVRTIPGRRERSASTPPPGSPPAYENLRQNQAHRGGRGNGRDVRGRRPSANREARNRANMMRERAASENRRRERNMENRRGGLRGQGRGQNRHLNEGFLDEAIQAEVNRQLPEAFNRMNLQREREERGRGRNQREGGARRREETREEQTERRRRRMREGRNFDPWVNLISVKVANPRLTAWRHR